MGLQVKKVWDPYGSTLKVLAFLATQPACLIPQLSLNTGDLALSVTVPRGSGIPFFFFQVAIG